MSTDRPKPNPWPARFIALGVIVALHGAIYYLVTTHRAKQAATADGRPAFTPIESGTGERSGSLKEKPSSPNPVAQMPLRWRFSAIDVWPAGMPAGEKVDLSAGGNNGVRVKSWTLPDYPMEWARAGEEGSVSLDVHLDERGKILEIKQTRSSASPRLEKVAQSAVSGWTFYPPLRESQPVTAWAEVVLQFKAYRYGLTRLAEPLPDGVVKAPAKPVSSDESFRDHLRALSSSKPAWATLENTQPDFQKMRVTVVQWGPAKSVRLLNPKESVWTEYAAASEFRHASEGGTIAVRWDLYDVKHEHADARWKVAVDPYGRIWAARADTFTSDAPATAPSR